MQVVELADVIFALSMEVLISVIFAQPLKAISRKKMAQLGFHKFVPARKLQCFTRPTQLGVLALIL